MSSAAKNPSTGANVEAGIGSRPLFFIHTSGNASRADAQRSLTLAQSKQVREPTREVRDSAAGDLSFVCADLACARAQDDPGHTYFSRSLSSPALSTTSTAHDGDDDLESFPAVPSLPTPSLPAWVADILRTPSPSAAEEFGTASWGSPYPESDHNLRRYSFSSETSDDSLIHHLNLDTPFLRSQPGPPQSESEPQSTVSAAAAVLANRARRRDRGLTEDWIRTHTTGIVNAEPKHWFSEGSETDHSSLSGSELGWLDSDLRTPRAASVDELSSSRQSRRPRGRSSVETLKPRDSFDLEAADTMAMATSEGAASAPDFAAGILLAAEQQAATPFYETPDEKMPRGEIEDAKPHVTPVKGVHKPLPKEPLMTPPIKKKVPWKGKNILVLIPRDDKRGLSGQSPMPLRSDEVDRMFASWKQLGYSVDGFDLLVEGYQPPGTDDSQSRQDWPSDADMAQERAGRSFKVTLPDLNAWKEYVNELQEAKLRALGVSLAEEEPGPPTVSPPTTNPSRQPSAQHSALPFSPPMPTSSASSNHGIAGYPFPGQFIPAAQSPGLPSGPSPVPFAAMPGKFNSRQSISLPAGPSPFQLRQPSPQAWHNGQSGIMHGLMRNDSPSLANFNGILSPQSPYGIDGLQQAGSPAFNPHQRHQSMQYLPQHMTARASPRLQEVIEEEGTVSRSPSMTPEPTRQNPDSLQAEIDDAEYHLEEQLREQLEHEDYNPQTQTEPPAVGPNPPAPALGQDRNGPGDMAVAQSFANEPGKPLILHHPRPHSRGHSLSQSFFRDHIEDQKSPEEGGRHKLDALSEMPEAQKVQELQEIQTNPSEPGTPGKTFDFPTALGQHEKTLSTISNPWHDSVSATGSTRRSSHGSKQSLSTLNVEAPEFKFNPGNTFIPGSFNFSGNSFQPAVFQAGNAAETPSAKSVSQFSGSAKFHATAPSFSPGQSDFSFSAFGPMFRPDAPAFTPFHPLSGSITSPGGSSSDNAGNRSSIFGSIDIKANDIIKPAKKSKAIPIVRPSSISSVKSTKASKPVDAIHEAPEDQPLHESRVKRAWSAAPDGDDVPLFAERPEDAPPETAPDTARDEHSGGEDGSILEGDNALLADTSMSSIVTSDHNETKATTAASSEISPIGNKSLKDWAPFEFGTNFEAPNFGESRIFGDDSKKGEIAKPLSTTAEPPASIDDQQTKESASSQDKEAQSAGPLSAPAEPSLQSSRPKLMPKGLGASRFASPPLPVDGLVASHFEEAASSVGIPESRPTESAKQDVIQSVEQDGTPAVEGAVEQITDPGADREPTFEEIDAVMQHLENNPSMGVNKSLDMSQWQPPTALMEADSPGADLQPPIDQFARDDPFIDPPASSHSPNLNNELDDAELESEPASDWEAAFSNEEHDKLESRAHFFDGRVNEVHALAPKSRRTPSSRRDMRSVSLEFQESDADDEDEELLPQRSMSPRRDRRMEHIRIAVTEAFAAQQRNQPPTSAAGEGLLSSGDPAILKTLGEIKEQLAAPTAARAIEPSKTAKGENEGQETPVPGTDEQILLKMQELQSKLVQFEDRLYQEQFNVEKAVAERRGAQDEAAELNRKLQAAETRVEVEIINRSVFDQRVADLEERLRQQEEKNEEEIKTRRAAEDRLSEVQRLLRISSEEETRLREVLDDRDEKIKSFEDASGKTAMQMALLEAAQTNSTQAQSEMTNKINALEADLKNVRQDNTHWRSEAERADEAAGRKSGELAHVLQENKLMQKSLTTLTSQLEENERLRESWRGKFMTLQDDMGRAARDIAEENARRIKKDQAMLARQEVLDARLQAEAKTRERLEVEMERLQLNERSGMRAVNECKRLEGLLVELQTENYKVQQSASRYQREFEEARESGVSEVKRTRIALQTEIDAANNLVNVIREELEEHNSKLRGELDNVKLEADTSRAQNEMLLEEVQTLKVAEIEDIKRKHQNELEDVQTRFERQISNASEDAQKAEQQLLERLSLSSSKIEHLQDRIVHLEDKLDIAKEAAAAAAQAAKSAGAEPGVAATLNTAPPQAPSRQLDMPEKISPQALRESIMVLQEQLQAREQRIEELEQIAAKADPDAASKISKRDDEISWLRELLAVRHGDLQDIIAALSGARYDREAVKDAAIRLKANLQMEEQERERAMNGGSAIHLPNIAQSIQAATPRVAQTIGPIAAAWGNWRKSNQQSFRSISGVLNVPAGNNATPSKGRGRPDSQSNPLGGLLTPPTSSLRQSPLVDTRPQPTAFSSTGRRYTVQSSVPNRARGESNSSRRSERIMTFQGTPPRQQEHRELMTPPMMHDTGYDSDAQPGDFDDQDFFEEEDE
ncbi:myosin class II heavy chain (MHC) [Hirsutella rhossiliensis]